MYQVYIIHIYYTFHYSYLYIFCLYTCSLRFELSQVVGLGFNCWSWSKVSQINFCQQYHRLNRNVFHKHIQQSWTPLKTWKCLIWADFAENGIPAHFVKFLSSKLLTLNLTFCGTVSILQVLNYCPKDMKADICVHLNRKVIDWTSERGVTPLTAAKKNS